MGSGLKFLKGLNYLRIEEVAGEMATIQRTKVAGQTHTKSVLRKNKNFSDLDPTQWLILS